MQATMQGEVKPCPWATACSTTPSIPLAAWACRDLAAALYLCAKEWRAGRAIPQMGGACVGFPGSPRRRWECGATGGRMELLTKCRRLTRSVLGISATVVWLLVFLSPPLVLGKENGGFSWGSGSAGAVAGDPSLRDRAKIGGESDLGCPQGNVFDDCLGQYCRPAYDGCAAALCQPTTSGCAGPCTSIYTAEGSACVGACRNLQDDPQ